MSKLKSLLSEYKILLSEWENRMQQEGKQEGNFSYIDSEECDIVAMCKVRIDVYLPCKLLESVMCAVVVVVRKWLLWVKKSKTCVYISRSCRVWKMKEREREGAKREGGRRVFIDLGEPKRFTEFAKKKWDSSSWREARVVVKGGW